MHIKQFEVPGLAQYAYMISDRGNAAVIDPMRDFDSYMAYADARELTITHVLETHIHADFASGAVGLAKQTGAELALSAHTDGERYRYAMPHTPLHDGASIQISGVRLQALHTPGHTPEHLSFIAFDHERSAMEPVAFFSGDFLFVGSLGRPDLLGEDSKRKLTTDLFTSLHERIADLPDSVELHPGHGAGSLCGAGMSDRPSSTLGYERKTNLFFGLNKDDFIAEILASAPPLPSYYPTMKKLNASGPISFLSLQQQRAFSPAEVRGLADQDDVILLDLRRPENFGGSHIPKAINIGAGQNLSLWAGWLLQPTHRIVLIAEMDDLPEARRSLARVGLDNVIGHLVNGMPTWIGAGYEIARTTQLSVREVQNIASELFILDVRSPEEWASGHIRGAQHTMLGDLPNAVAALPRDRTVLAVCGSGYRSSIAASLLAHSGFPNVASMSGGMAAWNAQALTLDRSP